MKTLKYKSRDQAVFILEELLVRLGYKVFVSQFFGADTRDAIKDFQLKNKLVVDGVVGLKTWSKLIEKDQQLTLFNDKFLSEDDITEFAERYHLDIPVVKAVNSVESRGKGFLIDGRPVILFEGHVFWQQLEKHGILISDYNTPKYENILYKKWTKTFYEGGSAEYTRLEKASGMSDKPEFHNAAYCSASWGAFQIMGYHYETLGYPSIDHFVSQMYQHEREHLKAFGTFLAIITLGGKCLMDWLREKNWAKFAHGYNGSGYAQNKYDTRLQKAYELFSS